MNPKKTKKALPKIQSNLVSKASSSSPAQLTI